MHHIFSIPAAHFQILTLVGSKFGTDASAVQLSFTGSNVKCEIQSPITDTKITCALSGLEVGDTRQINVRVGNNG